MPRVLSWAALSVNHHLIIAASRFFVSIDRPSTIAHSSYILYPILKSRTRHCLPSWMCYETSKWYLFCAFFVRSELAWSWHFDSRLESAYFENMFDELWHIYSGHTPANCKHFLIMIKWWRLCLVWSDSSIKETDYEKCRWGHLNINFDVDDKSLYKWRHLFSIPCSWRIIKGTATVSLMQDLFNSPMASCLHLLTWMIYRCFVSLNSAKLIAIATTPFHFSLEVKRNCSPSSALYIYFPSRK